MCDAFYAWVRVCESYLERFTVPGTIHLDEYWIMAVFIAAAVVVPFSVSVSWGCLRRAQSVHNHSDRCTQLRTLWGSKRGEKSTAEGRQTSSVPAVLLEEVINPLVYSNAMEVAMLELESQEALYRQQVGNTSSVSKASSTTTGIQYLTGAYHCTRCCFPTPSKHVKCGVGMRDDVVLQLQQTRDYVGGGCSGNNVSSLMVSLMIGFRHRDLPTVEQHLKHCRGFQREHSLPSPLACYLIRTFGPASKIPPGLSSSFSHHHASEGHVQRMTSHKGTSKQSSSDKKSVRAAHVVTGSGQQRGWWSDIVVVVVKEDVI